MTCSCHSSDVWYARYRRLFISRNGDNAKRTLFVATCSGCGTRREFPFASEVVPREVFCQTCSIWSKVEELSWDGLDFANLLPVYERTA